MKILIIGGTRFLGRFIVESGLRRGHQLTLFNRGQSNPDLYPDVEQIRDNRDGGLSVLQGRSWDAVIDTCGFVPRVVRAAAELLADAVDHYTLISSISAYKEEGLSGMDESAPLATMPDETVEEVNGETYGPLKALCEQAAEAAIPGRVLVVRPGLIVGPYDLTDRFTYWPVRIARGGEVLAPGDPDRPVEIIDVRDLADWVVRMTEAKQTGAFNASGPAQPLSMGQMLAEIKSALASDAQFTWVNDDFLAAQAVGAWIEMPLWIPAADNAILTVNCGKAIAAGLTFRPLADTARDTLAWANTRPPDYEWRAGLKPEREAEVQANWHAQGGR